ncbi:MAG: response regulator [Candidatus Pacearchaeota archaeon]|nr:response regulator [Candidatus Pacearchaeota archaeon]
MRNLVYIADDDEPNRNFSKEVVECMSSDYERKVRLFDNGKSLYDAIVENNEEVRLVLTDNDMPLMNGIDVIRKCKYLYPDIPFIAMSGRIEAKESLLEAGAETFLFKPFDPDNFEAVLTPYLLD